MGMYNGIETQDLMSIQTRHCVLGDGKHSHPRYETRRHAGAIGFSTWRDIEIAPANGRIVRLRDAFFISRHNWAKLKNSLKPDIKSNS